MEEDDDERGTQGSIVDNKEIKIQNRQTDRQTDRQKQRERMEWGGGGGGGPDAYNA